MIQVRTKFCFPLSGYQIFDRFLVKFLEGGGVTWISFVNWIVFITGCSLILSVTSPCSSKKCSIRAIPGSNQEVEMSKNFFLNVLTSSICLWQGEVFGKDYKILIMHLMQRRNFAKSILIYHHTQKLRFVSCFLCVQLHKSSSLKPCDKIDENWHNCSLWYPAETDCLKYFIDWKAYLLVLKIEQGGQNTVFSK